MKLRTIFTVEWHMSTGTVRASSVSRCADLCTPEQLRRQTKKREARSADTISAHPLPISPPGSFTLQPRHASLPLPARPGSKLPDFPNLQEHESVLCYTGSSAEFTSLPPCLRGVRARDPFSPWLFPQNLPNLGTVLSRRERAVAPPG